MSGKMKHRVQANLTEDLTSSVNEKILRDCHSLYADPENGLIGIGENVGLKLLLPRKKINVMLMGNHSAGKSSFINWYIEEHVQKTGVAIETQGFAFITSGRKRESLTGNATLHLFPQFQPLHDFEGVVDYLCTEISTSKQKKFPMVNFIDTPGLVDGDMKYPFDVNYTLEWIADQCDLIFVFFEPIGQALCCRTLNIVERINERHPEKLKFFLAKADEAGHETDRQRVMMQIVQELCKRPGLNKTGFDMPTIYIPNSSKQTRCVNQIEEACKDVEKTISQTVQNTMNHLEKDCTQLTELINLTIYTDNRARTYNKKARLKSIGLSFLGFIIPFSLLLQLLVASAPTEVVNALIGQTLARLIGHYMYHTTVFWESLGDRNQLTALALSLVFSAVCLLLSRIYGKTKQVLQKKFKKCLEERKGLLEGHIKTQKQRLYSDYLKQSAAEVDLP